MQLKYKFSFVCASLLFTSSIQAEDYVRVNFMSYSENDNRVNVIAPAIEVNKDFGVDYTLKASVIKDAVSGATPIYSDTTSGASAYKRGTVADVSKIKKENVDFTESRALYAISLTSRLKNRDEITTSYTNSYESDYDANTLSVDYLHWANKSKNRSYNVGISYSDNKVLIKNDPDSTSGASKKETSTTIATQVGISQILNKTSLAKADVFYSKEDGYLNNPYYNVVRNINEVHAENRPNIRTAYGFNLKYIRSFQKDFTSKFKYKFYLDDWGINSHTIDTNNYYTLNSKVVLGFGMRIYTQSEADFYNSDIKYFTNEKYASHDDRLSNFTALTYNASLKYKYSKKVSYDFAYSFYDQSTNLKANTFSMGIKYKF